MRGPGRQINRLARQPARYVRVSEGRMHIGLRSHDDCLRRIEPIVVERLNLRYQHGGKILAIHAGVGERLAIAHRGDFTLGNRGAVDLQLRTARETHGDIAQPGGLEPPLADLVRVPPAFQRHARRSIEPISNRPCGIARVTQFNIKLQVVGGKVRVVALFRRRLGKRVALQDFQLQFGQHAAKRGRRAVMGNEFPRPRFQQLGQSLGVFFGERIVVECRKRQQKRRPIDEIGRHRGVAHRVVFNLRPQHGKWPADKPNHARLRGCVPATNL